MKKKKPLMIKNPLSKRSLVYLLNLMVSNGI